MPQPTATPASAAVLAPRLQPPRGNARLLPREAVIARLVEARRLRCVVINGAAGAGKTTVLAAWRKALMPLGFEVAWLSLAPQDNDPSRFLDALAAAIATVNPGIAAEVGLVGDGALGGEDFERLLVTLVRGIEARSCEQVLMLDDVHFLSDARIHAMLQWLLDYAPPHLHIALVTRAPLPLSLARLRAQQLVLELGPQDLQFTQAETAQLLTLLPGAAMDARSAQHWHQLTDGWVAGLQLLALHWRRTFSRQPSLARQEAPLRDAHAFSQFFEREVFARLDGHDMRMFIVMAVCDRFCGALCAVLADCPRNRDALTERLAQMESENLFISVFQEGEVHDGFVWYRMHPLLRETLLQRFALADASRRKIVHARAWRWFSERGFLEEAVGHAVQAGELDHAAELVERCVQALVLRGDRAKAVALLRQLPEAQQQSRIGLRLWCMRMKFFMREVDACAQSIDQLRLELGSSNAPASFFVDLCTASLAVQRDDREAVLQLLPVLAAPPVTADPMAVGGSRNVRSWLHLHRGEYEAARAVQTAAPLRVDGQLLMGTPAGSLYGRCLVGMSHALEGQMREAEHVQRAVLQEAEAKGKACVDIACFAAALLGEALYELNEPGAVRKLLEPRVDLLERIGIPDAVLRAMKALSDAYWLCDLRMESIAWLERLEKHAVQRKLPRLLAHAVAGQALRRMELGQTLAVQADMERLDGLASCSSHACSAATEVHILALHVRTRWNAEQGSLDHAMDGLRQLVVLCDSLGWMRAVAGLLMEAAVVDARRGNIAVAREKARAAMRHGHRLGLVRSLLDVNEAMPNLRALLCETQEAPDPVLGFYLERLEAVARSSGAQAAPSGRRAPRTSLKDMFSGREIDMLSLLNLAMPNKKIARTLGLSPETVKWYLSRIYAKLQVAGRDEAIARVRDLGWGDQLPTLSMPAGAGA